jgi:non-specific serine/threonine protein kinase
MISDAFLLASLDMESSDFAAALARFREIIGLAVDPLHIVLPLFGIARLAAGWGDLRAAVRLLGATVDHEVYRRSGAEEFASRASSEVAALRATLGEQDFAAAWAEGQRMSFDDAVAYALAIEPPSTTSAAPPPVLTAREQEVVRLIAEGKTNREIATALVIAEPTAERHVANVLSKLGFHTRAQIAVWHERQMNASRFESGHSVH